MCKLLPHPDSLEVLEVRLSEVASGVLISIQAGSICRTEGLMYSWFSVPSEASRGSILLS